jgi:hypothetical protein
MYDKSLHFKPVPQAKLSNQKVYSRRCGTKLEISIFKTSGTERKYVDNSFRNDDFHVPLTSGTRPERRRNAKRNEAYVCRSFVDSLSFT